MDTETIRIDELFLRVPGLNEMEARRLAADVARRVADGLSIEGREAQLALQNIRVSLPSGLRKERLAERIAEEILQAVR